MSEGENSQDPRRPEAELEDALAHAELMLASYDRASRELRTLRLVEWVVLFGTVILAATATALGLFAQSSTKVTLFALAIVLLVVGGGTVRRCLVLQREVREQCQRDEFGLVDLSSLVREYLPVDANRGHWTDVKQLTMRARLARFPISERSR